MALSSRRKNNEAMKRALNCRAGALVRCLTAEIDAKRVMAGVSAQRASGAGGGANRRCKNASRAPSSVGIPTIDGRFGVQK
ncbi:hypothetical protein [Burkholderia sp. LMG 32019]|uniref:hypothetical protein n=1 Tax=Burkholderia sp. LMG 32019 TaxID=3158173 RepID=UPI003C2FA6F6